MKVIKRGNIYWLDLSMNGARHRESLKTSNRREALQRAKAREKAIWEEAMQERHGRSDGHGQRTHPEPPPAATEDPIFKQMPRFATEEEFKAALAHFHELTHPLPWKATRANKQHIDLFGETIKAGEVYYALNSPPAFHCVDRLSRKSMEAVLYVLFQTNQRLETLAQTLRELRFKAYTTAAEKAGSGITRPDIRGGKQDNTAPTDNEQP